MQMILWRSIFVYVWRRGRVALLKSFYVVLFILKFPSIQQLVLEKLQTSSWTLEHIGNPFSSSIRVDSSSDCYPSLLRWSCKRFAHSRRLCVSPSIRINEQDAAQFEPDDGIYYFIHRRRLFFFQRQRGDIKGLAPPRREEWITLRTLGFNARPIKELIDDIAIKGQGITLYVLREKLDRRFTGHWKKAPDR